MSLFQAIKGNNLKLFQQIIQRPDINVNQMDDHQNTLLHMAIAYKKIEMVKELLKHNANVNAVNSHNYTPLHFAILCYSDNEMIELLLQSGAKINSQDRDGWTALYTAGYFGYRNQIDLLLEYGADVAIKTNNNQSVFDLSDSNTVKFIHFCLLKKELYLLWELNSCD